MCVALYVGQSILHFFFIYFFTRQHFHAKAGKEMPWLATKKGGLNHNIIYCNHDKCGAKWKMQMSQGIPLHIVSICISPVSRIFD